MNIEELQLITRTETANAIINLFYKNKKTSNEILLRFLKSNLIRRGVLVHEDQFLRFFKELEEIGVGTHNDFNGQPAGRFVSNYNLFDIAEQILNPNKMINIRRIGQESQPEPKQIPLIKPVIKTAATPLVVQKPASIQNTTLSQPQVVFMFTTVDGKFIPFPLHEVPRLVEQADLIKSRMS